MILGQAKLLCETAKARCIQEKQCFLLNQDLKTECLNRQCIKAIHKLQS